MGIIYYEDFLGEEAFLGDYFLVMYENLTSISDHTE